MPLLNSRDVNFIKLKALKREYLADFCNANSVPWSANLADTIEAVLQKIDTRVIPALTLNNFIKNKFQQLRQLSIAATGATHHAIITELEKVDSHIWGMVQGAVDAHIQANYVRKYFKYDDIINAVRSTLYSTIESYTLCTWYNHWSTEIIEDLIAGVPNVIPVIKKVKGVDIIWNEQPVDIKVTNLNREWFSDGHTIEEAINNPILASEYFYRLQGAQRFGSDNRLFIVIYDKTNPSESWKIKRDYNLLKSSITAFFSQNVSLDPVTFQYGNTQHHAYSKILFITR